jgi:formylglycine-generating enzyme required for sulfatase activity
MRGKRASVIASDSVPCVGGRALAVAVGFALAFALTAGATATARADSMAREMVRVPGGTYVPFYPVKDEVPAEVAPFLLDVVPVTTAEFLEFVRAAPEWRRSRISPLFADTAYLSPWSADLDPGDDVPMDAPVTFVSWFAAEAFCRAEGKRLPREAEWELAAAPALDDPATRAETQRRILASYARPRGPLPPVGSTPPNALGVRDLHGVIWEWLEDFNASFAAADNRSDRDRDMERFCGGAAVGAADQESYATFMRTAFRSSLQATYALHHLGFRCARSLP